MGDLTQNSVLGRLWKPSGASLALVLACAPLYAGPRDDPSSLAARQAKAAAQTLRAAGLDTKSSGVWIGTLEGKPLLQHRSQEPLNPASVMKLVTTAAALQTLGPTYTWQTRVDVQGVINSASRSLKGNLVLRGSGDPKLVVERLEQLLRQVRDAGIDHIEGDILLDRRAFSVPERDPGEFDGEPLRPYNARPDPLLINFKAVVLNFKPDAVRQVADVSYEPPLAGFSLPASIALSAKPCGDWRGALGADFTDANAVRFSGQYPAACGERVWPVAYADPASHSARAVAAMWAKVGGTLTGQVLNAPANSPALTQPAKPLLQFASLPLTDVVRDVNKFSNNVMAQHVFLALPNLNLAKRAGEADTVNLGDARRAATRWWEAALGNTAPPVLDNGSGLSRQERVSAQGMGRLLVHMRASPQAAVFFDTLPNAGVDGTLNNLRGSSVQGMAQLKTGSLRDATSLAGRFTTASGEERIFVAIYNGTRTTEARQAMYCLLQRQIFGGGAPSTGRNLCRKGA